MVEPYMRIRRVFIVKSWSYSVGIFVCLLLSSVGQLYSYKSAIRLESSRLGSCWTNILYNWIVCGYYTSSLLLEKTGTLFWHTSEKVSNLLNCEIFDKFIPIRACFSQ